jgi:hypothetical protein
MGNLSLNIFTFPLWWYTTGVYLVWVWFKRQVYFGLHNTGILVFAKHIREPLYGDYTRTGIILSFFLRLIILFYKLLVFCLRIIFLLAIFLIYLLALPVSLTMVLVQLLPL